MACVCHIQVQTLNETHLSIALSITPNISLVHPSPFTIVHIYWHDILWSSQVPVSLTGLLWRLAFAWPIGTNVDHYLSYLTFLRLLVFFIFPLNGAHLCFTFDLSRTGVASFLYCLDPLALIHFSLFLLVLKYISFSLLKYFLGFSITLLLNPYFWKLWKFLPRSLHSWMCRGS